jgi:hypothetical protein
MIQLSPQGQLSEYLRGEKSMAMKLVKRTDEYSIYQRSDDRYAVKDANKKPINGDEKVRILVAEELIKAALPAEPEPDEAVEEEVVAEEASAEEAEARRRGTCRRGTCRRGTCRRGTCRRETCRRGVAC